jgi:choline dehydrogenase-like flavoprotein
VTDPRRVIVIGSGPSGATAALTLSRRGVPVTLLESGTRFPRGLVVRALGRNLFRKWAPWGANGEGYAYAASADPDTQWWHELSPGGLSNYWTGAVPRFAPPDFFEGERLHERYRWPLTYTDLEPYYTRAEELLGVVGERRAIPQVSPTRALVEELRLPDAWQRIAAHADQVGQGLMFAPLADGPRWLIRGSGAAFNSYERIVAHLGRFPEFELRLGAHAQRLLWNPASGRVDGVEYFDRATGTIERVWARAVVVAAGPLASAKLLLQSVSDDFPHGLGNQHGLVGRFLHDHPKDWSVLELDRAHPRLAQPLYLSRAPYAESPPLSGASMTIGPLSKWDRVLSLAGAKTHRFGVVTFATMLPEETNYVRLHPEQRDRFGSPALDIHIRFGPDVVDTIADTRVRLRTILRQAGLRFELHCPLDKLVPGNAAHYAGTVRMHASPEYGVLDGWNRIHAAPNVTVVDASSFTTAVEKNPTLTLMALAARASDHLADELLDQAEMTGQQAYAVPAVR